MNHRLLHIHRLLSLMRNGKVVGIVVSVRQAKCLGRELRDGGRKVYMEHTNVRRLYPVPAVLPPVHPVRQQQARIPDLNLLLLVLCSCEVGGQEVHPDTPRRGLQRKNPQRVRKCRGLSTPLVACNPGILVLCILKTVPMVMGMINRAPPRQSQ